MAEYLKEYKTLPDDFMEHDVEQLENEHKPENFELNAENLKKAGKATRKNDELFEISKGYLVGDTEKFGEALMSDGGPEEKFGTCLVSWAFQTTPLIKTNIWQPRCPHWAPS